MRNFRIIAVVLAAFSLAGCAGTRVGDLLQVATSSVVNPIGATDIYRVKNAYAAALELAVEYRQYCWSKPYDALMADPVSKPVCERRRAVVRFAQSARQNAGGAIAAAENFVAANPTLNASTVIGAAWQAVAAFQNSVPLPKN